MRVERGAWLEIDTAKLIHNHMEVMHAVEAESKRCGRKIKVCSVLKAQCYGIGGVQTAKILESLDCPPDAYAVACLSEALELRTVTADKEILILGYVAEDCYDTAIANGITLPMYRADALEAFNRKAGEMGRKGLVHIAVNSGMNRLGFLPTEENADVVAAAFQLPNLEINGIFTHLAVADETDKTPARMQMGRFDAFLDMLRARNVTLPTVHAAASPSICDLPEYYKDMVRSGLLLTGYYASEEVSRDRVQLQPAVKLKAKLGNVMPVKKGEGVGYGFTYHLPEDTLIGLIPVGFSDGLARIFSNNFYVTIRGHKCPIVGKICMDHCMIDLKEVPDPVVGEEVVIYGDGTDGPDGAMNVLEVADKRGSIPDEVLTNINARIPRIFV